MRFARHAVLALSSLLVAGCSSAPTAEETKDPTLRARADELSNEARSGWHLPLRVRVRAPEAAKGVALAQLDEVREAYARATFDFYAADVSVGETDEARATFTAKDGTLAVALPASAKTAIAADALLATLAVGFSWTDVGPWWKEEPDDDVVKALGRDLGKVDALEDELSIQCRRLELLAGTVLARADATKQEALLSPAEAANAREAQLRFTLALHRVLNTIARWRSAADAPTFAHRGEARLVLLRARLVHEAYLGWFLDTVVGTRPLVAVWESAWWQRNPLFPVLDAQADLGVIPLAGPRVASPAAASKHGSIPAGSVRALLALRCDGSLASTYSAIDGWELPSSFAKSPLADACAAALARVPATRELARTRATTAFRAWKELWDARLKNGFGFPFYKCVASIGCFLGGTRTEGTPPALREKALEEFGRGLRPGDVLLVRQEHFLSNAFLPGFWPHALIHLGPKEDWGALRLPDGTRLADDPVAKTFLARYESRDGHAPRIVEAISSGVQFGSLEHAVAKDFVAHLRPLVSEGEIAESIRRAIVFVGRPYDFDFDFATDDRVVCTELVYRAYDPLANFRVAVDAKPGTCTIPGILPVMGRLTMPANELARYAIYMDEHPQPDASVRYPGKKLELVRLVEPDGQGGARVLEGEAALRAFKASVNR